jgi:hypothetical protein
MPIKRVVRVKSCNANKNQECFLAKKGSRRPRRSKPRSRVSKPRSRVSKPRRRVSKPRSRVSKPRSRVSKPRRRVSKPRSRVSKPRRRVSKPRRRVSKPRRSRSRSKSRSKPRRLKHRRSRPSRKRSSRKPRRSSRKPRRSRKRSGSGGSGGFSKSPDVMSQLKNFMKIDQKITYMIQHPRKAKRKNVLKLLAAILLFLAVLCGIMKMMGNDYDYCAPVIKKVTDVMSGLKNSAMHPTDALSAVQKQMGELYDQFKKLAPVQKLGDLGGMLGKLGGMFKPSIKFSKLDSFGTVKQKITENDQFTARRAYLLGLVTTAQGDQPDTNLIGDSFKDVPDINKYIV